ncbi:HAE1 family hydrophobic/amphiphilic exporter-1 [Cytobacillus oceanisediminis]|uniref:HAE1 family hydrophobic/amphiphilic exporter-1 n=1 Tax=Cytobacillus oceanisediminis TaxID=665099 RepID=A0A2V2ZII4_9BACI|nr:efflux RND transporter permease subunit [Cytobacillus oceanisediminis]PWW19464.1 HAE1 family hydrophobic/amphiphilic exporter-1 [Cytobacillus oceanisediminis]
MRISDFSIRRPIFTLVSMFLVLILGVVSLLNIPLKLIPDINPPVGVVVTSYPGASPDEVVEKVTKPLEENLATLPGIKTLTSTSQESANFILMQFSWTTDIDEIQSEVIQRLDQTQLPEDADDPRFMKFDPSQFPIIQLSLSADEDSQTLRKLAEELNLELTKVEGVASVNMSGTAIKEVRVELDQEKLRDYKLSQADVVDVIQSNNISMPGDPVLTEGKELTTRIISSLDSLDTLKELTVTINPATGENVSLQDIAEVQLTNQDDRTITRTNQSPSVLLSVLQQSDANTAEVSEEFIEKLDDLLEQEQYEGIESEILFDQGDYINLAIGNISNSLLLGGVFAMIVLFFFLKNVKSPLIIGISIPYSVIFTFVLMYFSDFTLNIMTLGGLALGIGMLVDNAIVVIENIYRHLSMGKDPKAAASDGAKEVGSAITASTLTTVAVFIPVVFISGIIGELFTEFALTISFSLFASLVVALTVVPMLASRLLKAPKTNLEAKRQESGIMRLLERSIKWSLRNRAVVIAITMLLLAAGSFGLTTVGTQFLPNTDEGFFTVRMELENGTALSETEKVITAVEEELKDEDEVDTYVSLIGTTQEGSFRGSANANIAELYIKMKELDERERSTFEFVDDVKKDFEKAASKVNESADLSFNMQSSSGTAPNTLTFSVRDTDPNRLNENVDKIYNGLKDLDDVTELTTDLMDTVEEIQITVDREKALEQGLAPAQIAMAVNDVTRGNRATQMIDDESNIYGVFVEYDKEITQDIDNLKTLLIKKPDGNYVSLDEVTNIERGEGPVNIQRINQQDAVQFTLKYKSSTNMGAISKVVDKEIADLELPEETEVVFSGDRELLESSIDDMALAFILAIVFIYLVMAAQFESLKYPFVIMFTVPLMIIGVAIALTATRTPISLTAIIGIIVLAGIVVNNAIVIVDYINQKKENGLKTYDAIVISVKDRARPILMTALTTILGLVPLALGIGEGTEINQPMGITVIGGLISSTFLTLFVIPVVYSFFDKDTRRLNKLYATPEGHLVPAYLLEERVEREERQDREAEQERLPSAETRPYSRNEMAAMLEELSKILKEDKKEKKNHDRDEESR